MAEANGGAPRRARRTPAAGTPEQAVAEPIATGRTGLLTRAAASPTQRRRRQLRNLRCARQRQAPRETWWPRDRAHSPRPPQASAAPSPPVGFPPLRPSTAGAAGNPRDRAHSPRPPQACRGTVAASCAPCAAPVNGRRRGKPGGRATGLTRPGPPPASAAPSPPVGQPPRRVVRQAPRVLVAGRAGFLAQAATGLRGAVAASWPTSVAPGSAGAAGTTA